MIEHILPVWGSSSGGTVVTVYGQNMVNNMQCRMGSIVSFASFVSTSSVTCLSPAYAVGTSSIDLSDDTQQFTSSGLVFEFYGLMNNFF